MRVRHELGAHYRLASSRIDDSQQQKGRIQTNKRYIERAAARKNRHESQGMKLLRGCSGDRSDFPRVRGALMQSVFRGRVAGNYHVRDTS